MKEPIKWYWFRDCRCVVGSPFAFVSERAMKNYFRGVEEFVEVETPDYAREGMIEY